LTRYLIAAISHTSKEVMLDDPGNLDSRHVGDVALGAAQRAAGAAAGLSPSPPLGAGASTPSAASRCLEYGERAAFMAG
jgi:hypothetical protein